MSSNLPGGFVHPSLPSPAPSTHSSSTVSPSSLPQQRAHPLRPGSAKETSVINYVDAQILKMNRRHAKKFSSSYADKDETVPGYESFKEVGADVEAAINVLWVSGTPSLQIPYFISLAGLVNSYLPDFPFAPRSTFRLVRKMDNIFASLLQGEDVESGATLPGFESKKDQVSMTEMVRIKSIAESTRITIVDVQDKEGGYDEEDDEAETDDDNDNDNDGVMGGALGDGFAEDALGRWEMAAARTYEKTIQLLGDELGKQELVS